VTQSRVFEVRRSKCRDVTLKRLPIIYVMNRGSARQEGGGCGVQVSSPVLRLPTIHLPSRMGYLCRPSILPFPASTPFMSRKLQCIRYVLSARPLQHSITIQLHLEQSHPPIVLHHNRASHRRLVRHPLPNRIDVRSFEITSAVPAPTPHYQAHSLALDGTTGKRGKGGIRTVSWAGVELEGFRFFRREQTVVWAEPRPVLWVRARIVREASEALVPADGGQVPPFWVDDIKYSL